jgi:hypothetical protein
MIGYVDSAINYFTGGRPKKAQSIPASLFWRNKELGLHFKKNKKVRKLLDSLGELENDSSLSYMPFNLFISEKHKLSFKVSEHQLQNGSVIADHIHQELREVTIEGMFTNHPLKKLANTSEVKFKDDFATSEVRDTVSNTALENFTNLRNLAKKRIPVRLVCSLENYPRMVITDISYDRDSKSGSSIRFSMTLRELKVVDLKNVTSSYKFQPSDMESVNNRIIASEINAGARNATEIEVDRLAKINDPEVLQ